MEEKYFCKNGDEVKGKILEAFICSKRLELFENHD